MRLITLMACHGGAQPREEVFSGLGPTLVREGMHCTSLMNKGDTPAEGPAPGDCSKAGDPVDLGTGLFVYQKTDLVLKDVLPISLTRTYRPKDSIVRSFGKGTTNPYDIYVAGDTANYGQIVLPDGSLIRFNRIPNSSPAVYEHIATWPLTARTMSQHFRRVRRSFKLILSSLPR